MKNEIVIKVEKVSKQYRLGTVGVATLKDDFQRWLAKIRGKEDPFLKVGSVNDRDTTSGSDYVWALKDINLQINRGDVVGIIGKNGAGKSTFLKLLAKVTAPTTGDVKIKGRVASLLEVGTGFHPELTGRENVYLNGAILGMTKAEISNRFDSIVDFSGIGNYLDTPVKRYSSGMYVRLAFSVAIHLNSEILIVDEVLAVGDFDFQRKCLAKMKEFANSGKTVLFVSHNINSLLSLCQQGILFEHGRLIKQGNIKEVVDLYLDNNDPDSIVSKGIISENSYRNVRNSSDEVRINRVTVLNELHEETTSLFFCEPFTLCLKMTVKQKVTDVYVRITILSADGIRVCCITNFDDSISTLNIEQGKHELKIKLNPKLLPGKYYFELAVVSYDDKTIYENITNVLTFEVKQTSREEGKHFKWITGNYYGFFRCNAEWELPDAIKKINHEKFLI